MDAHTYIRLLEDIGIGRHDDQETVYKYVSVDTALKIIETQTLKFSRADEFNDPFELHMGLIDFDYPDEETLIMYKRMFGEQFVIPDQMSINWKDLYIQSMKFSFQHTRSKNIGITCFTRNPRNTLMWSHYGDRHKGVCLGFKVPAMAGNIQTMRVNYVPSITPVRYFSEDEGKFALWYWIFTKSRVWKYEEEVRTVNLLESGILPFSDIQIVEVYYGAGTNIQDIVKVEKALSERRTVIKKQRKMTIDNSTFNLKEIKLNLPKDLIDLSGL